VIYMLPIVSVELKLDVSILSYTIIYILPFAKMILKLDRRKVPNIKESFVAHKFEIYKDKAGEFRVRFKHNSEIMFSTEGYASKASAKNAIASIQKNGPGAPTEDNS